MTTPCCGVPVQCEHPETECLIREAHARQAAEKPLYHPLYHPLASAEVPAPAALATQVGGSHYKDCKIQPVQYIHANGLGFCEGSVVKYITRWKSKGGVKDLEKAKHFIDLLIELENAKSA